MTGTRLLFLLILPSVTLAAPQAQEISSRDEVVTVDLANPFGSGENNHRLLTNYIQSTMKEDQAGPELNTREQELFFLFSLHDYDRSGQIDGLELMQLLTDFLSHHAMMPKSEESVVPLVDFLLQTQDLNQDGLLVPSELLSSSTDQQEDIVPTDNSSKKPSDKNSTLTTAEDGDSDHQQAGENQQFEEKAVVDGNQIQDSAREEQEQAEEPTEAIVKEQEEHEEQSDPQEEKLMVHQEQEM